MKASINPALCTGCESCTKICPEVFKKEGDKSMVYQDPVSEPFQAKCRDAAGQCTANAILVQD